MSKETNGDCEVLLGRIETRAESIINRGPSDDRWALDYEDACRIADLCGQLKSALLMRQLSASIAQVPAVEPCRLRVHMRERPTFRCSCGFTSNALVDAEKHDAASIVKGANRE